MLLYRQFAEKREIFVMSDQLQRHCTMTSWAPAPRPFGANASLPPELIGFSWPSPPQFAIAPITPSSNRGRGNFFDAKNFRTARLANHHRPHLPSSLSPPQ
jgi:hypothetical protein